MTTILMTIKPGLHVTINRYNVIDNLSSFLLYQFIEIVNIVYTLRFLVQYSLSTTVHHNSVGHGGSTVVVVISSLFSKKSKTVTKTKKKVKPQMVAEEKGIFSYKLIARITK